MKHGITKDAFIALQTSQYVCVSLCLSLHQDLSGTTRLITTKLSVDVAYGCGSVLFRQGDEIPRESDSFGRFLPPLTTYCTA